MSWPPRLCDDPAECANHRKFPDQPDTDTATVVAPCCGRECAADMVVDLRGVPGTTIRPGGGGAEEDVPFACDACYRRVSRSGRNPWTESQLVRALGAPSEVVAEKRARELLLNERRKGGPVKPREFLAEKKAELRGRAEVPGTAAPVSADD